MFEPKKPINILIEVLPLSLDVLTGIGRAVQHILNELQNIDCNNNYYLFSYSDVKHFEIRNSNWSYMIYNSPIREYKNKIRLKWFQLKEIFIKNKTIVNLIKLFLFRIYKMILEVIDIISIRFIKSIIIQYRFKKLNIDTYIGTSANYFPPLLPKKIKKVIIVYDLVWKFYPNTMAWGNRVSMVLNTKNNYKRADKLVAISNSTKNDLVKILKIKKPIITIPLAADKELFYKSSIGDIKHVIIKYGIKKRYLLSVCTLEPRKNLERLLYAVSKIQATDDIMLVLVGMKGWIGDTFFSLINELNLKDKIIITGYVPNEDLAPLYTGADVFVYPSLYEGFGLPVLEALQCGCPVITSNSSSLPEVVGDAAILVNPKNVDEISQAIDRVLMDKFLKKELKKLGLKQSKKYSWENTGKLFYETMMS